MLRLPLVGRLSQRLILMYHGISDGDADDSLTVRFSEFRRQIEFVADRFEVVSLSGLLDHDRERPSAVITIDDGYAQLLDAAVPFLLERRVPFTLFVPAGLLGKSLRRGAKDVPLVSDADVQGMSSAGCAIGSHSLSHRELTGLSDDEARIEIRDSKSALEDLVGQPVTAFSYPRGKFLPQHPAMVRDAGYTHGVTTSNLAVKPGADPFLLPRIRVDALTSWPKFQLKLTRLGDRYVRLRRRISQ